MTINELKQQIQNLPDDFNVEISVIDANENYSSFSLEDISVEVERFKERIVFYGTLDRG